MVLKVEETAVAKTHSNDDNKSFNNNDGEEKKKLKMVTIRRGRRRC